MTRATFRHHWLAIALALWAQAAVLAAPAVAQIVVLRVDPAAEPLCADFETVLGEFGVAADPGYFAEAQRRGLDPSSDHALAQLTPPLQVRLAVVPQASDARAVLVEFRDGASGQSLGTASVPLTRGRLGRRGQRVLVDEVRQRLEPSSAEPVPADPPIEGEEAPAETIGDGASSMRARVHAGLGFGTRDLEWPASGEMLAVHTGAFVAVDLGASVALVLGDGFALGPELAYQTSLDHQVEEQHVSGQPQTIAIRAHRFEALLAAAFAIGDGGFWIAPALGYGVRNLRPEVHHLLTPSYSLAGPLVRVTVRIPFADSVALRLAPELQYVLVGDELEERGVEGSGLAFGGDAALELVLSASLATELTFREAHAVMPSTLGGDSTDVERFATLRLVWLP